LRVVDKCRPLGWRSCRLWRLGQSRRGRSLRPGASQKRDDNQKCGGGQAIARNHHRGSLQKQSRRTSKSPARQPWMQTQGEIIERPLPALRKEVKKASLGRPAPLWPSRRPLHEPTKKAPTNRRLRETINFSTVVAPVAAVDPAARPEVGPRVLSEAP